MFGGGVWILVLRVPNRMWSYPFAVSADAAAGRGFPGDCRVLKLDPRLEPTQLGFGCSREVARLSILKRISDRRFNG